MFKIEFFLVLIANKIFHATVLFYLLLRPICGTGNSSLQCLSTINMVFSDEDKILIYTQIHSAYTVTCIEELKSVHLKCNLFAFSSIVVEYLQQV